MDEKEQGAEQARHIEMMKILVQILGQLKLQTALLNDIARDR